MLDPHQIETWIAAGLPCQHLRVDGDGQHFEAVIVSVEFAGMNRVKRQQRVYQTIKDRLDSGELHAISMQTLTPEEWESRGG
ncbi:BolA family protein [Denitratisoma oestradiolicum]|uniref:Putative transcriptional regulator, BolA superfamily n=1 Tax=Denitratisoma oestradiolicum TaxID=311182 RepID=A0A6S6XV04_9PROT|nr:BolA family protein [Denitratisoma oestradiolicum]TWO81172.1 BolA family transcriptional regulator [Denitratisoma oestradiolicum]CAB1367867.1 putative transcriptional regulator, BolA superfamily [Denitratisoma oestradiolicum]